MLEARLDVMQTSFN